MNTKTKHEVLQAHLKEWMACKGDRKRRGELTKKLSSLLKIHQKSVGRAMKRLQTKDKRIPEKRGRKKYYTEDVDNILYEIWEFMNYPCAENMHPVIGEYIEYILKENPFKYEDVTIGKARNISLGTLKLRTASFRKRKGFSRGKSATVSSPLKGLIPIRKNHSWKDLPPGYLQIDSVVHCGDKLTGDVLYSVGSVDFATYWSEYTSQWNKGQTNTLESLKLLSKRIPFEVKEIHPDTGNEFINYHVYKWSADNNISMTRSEPYKKNDNMCIEERNNSIARKHLGYARLDDEAFVELSSEILRLASLLHNHFIPVRRLISKERVGARWKRVFEKVSKTPYQRVLESKEIPLEVKEKLRKEHEKLNPLQLKRELDRLKEELGRMLLKVNKDRRLR